MEKDSTLGRRFVSVPSLVCLGMNVLCVLSSLYSIVPIHRGFRDLFLAPGYGIPARSRDILSIPPAAIIASGLLLLALLIAKEWVLKSRAVALVMNVAALALVWALIWMWLAGLFAVQVHIMDPR